MSTATEHCLTITGHGLITGLPVKVEITLAKPGQGVVFYVQDKPDAERQASIPLPAKLAHVVHTDRGVTLASATGQTLSIVEHFLCGVAMSGQTDLNVSVQGTPELPILDGSAQVWFDALKEKFGTKPVSPDITLKGAVFYRLDESVCLYALPSEHYEVTYAVNYDHPDLKNQWVHWSSDQQEMLSVLQARTYGYLSELPALQAKGLAKGVTLENTLGLTEDGQYTSPLRVEREPIYHKILDLTGDLMLMGINPRRLKAHIYVLHGGHTGHTAFAKKLMNALILP